MASESRPTTHPETPVNGFRQAQSPRLAGQAVWSHELPAGEPWLGPLHRGQTLRIVDLHGNQAVDTLFYNAADTAERYSAVDTLRLERALYLGAGSRLWSTQGRVLARIVADTCGRHDTLGGACAAESNTVRYGLHTRHMHSCRDSFLRAITQSDYGLGKRDLTHNINFFMNVPVTPDGGLSFADGVSAPGKYVEVTAELDLLVLISNCPQLNNPCNGWNPTPVGLLMWDAP